MLRSRSGKTAGSGASDGVARRARRRLSLAVTLSLGLHALVGAALVGSSLLGAWPTAPIDVEITGMHLQDPQDLPLGAPPPGTGRAGAGEATPPAEPVVSPARDHGPRPARKEKPRPPAPANDEPDGGAPPPRPESVRSYAPAGSRVTALLRIDRLRGTDYASVVDALLMHLPDRRDLLDGTDIDLYRDLDAVLIATPNPLDATVTFLAVRHHLTDAAVRAALDRGARATGRTLAWRTERGRPFAERRLARTAAVGSGAVPPSERRDNRLILLATPTLAVVTPPAYRSLILEGRAAKAPRPAAAEAGADGGARDTGPPIDAAGDGTDGGADVAADRSSPRGAPRADEHASWAALIRRIDAEDGILPSDAVAMVSVEDLFTAPGARARSSVAPGTRGTDDDEDASSASPPTVLGLPVPRLVTVTLGIAPAPFADVEATFAAESDAIRWEEEWPALRARWRSAPVVVFTGFSGLIGRSTLGHRTGATVHARVDATEMETIRILQFLAAEMTAVGH